MVEFVGQGAIRGPRVYQDEREPPVAVGPAAAATVVVGVTDGDTLDVVDRAGGSAETRIRLRAIDAPEGAQPFGDRAREALKAMVLGREVRVVARDRDRYGRTVAEVFVGAENVNARLVAGGWAWAYVEYGRDYVSEEAQARKARGTLVSRWADRPLGVAGRALGGGRAG